MKRKMINLSTTVCISFLFIVTSLTHYAGDNARSSSPPPNDIIPNDDQYEDPEVLAEIIRSRYTHAKSYMTNTPRTLSYVEFSRLIDNIELEEAGLVLLRALRAPNIDDPFLYRVTLRPVSY